MPDTLRPGDIVFATMIDPQGGNEKSRTALIVVQRNDNSYVVVAITSTFRPNEVPPENHVELPWKRGEPRCHTGLVKPSRADVDWFTQNALAGVEKIGYVKASQFAAILKLFIERLGNRKI